MHSLLAKTRTRITAYFLTRLFAVLPLVITVAIVIWVASFVHQFLGPGTHAGKLIEQLGSCPDGESSRWIAYLTVWAWGCCSLNSESANIWLYSSTRSFHESRWWGRFTGHPSSWLTCLTGATTKNSREWYPSFATLARVAPLARWRCWYRQNGS